MSQLIKIFILIVGIFSSPFIQAKVIAKIPEASGICYVKKSQSLFVVNDEGTLYKLNKDGKVLRKMYLGKYDLEGITYNPKDDKLLLAVEDAASILVVNRDSLEFEKEIKIKRKFEKVNLLKKSKKGGLEAIAIDRNGDIYVSNQSKVTYTKKLKENGSVVVKINGIEKKKAKIVEVYNHGYIDIAGLTFHNGYLYMVSDTKNLLIQYDIKKNKTVKKIKLPKAAQEGICFDDDGHVYIADDNGRILRYKTKKLGL